MYEFRISRASQGVIGYKITRAAKALDAVNLPRLKNGLGTLRFACSTACFELLRNCVTLVAKQPEACFGYNRVIKCAAAAINLGERVFDVLPA